MKKVILAVLVMMMLPAGASYASDVYVNGYTRSNGTYVQPYVRSSPDAYKSNNYGYQR